MTPKIWNEGSGSSKHDDFANRPVLRQLLSAVDGGQVKHIWVFNTDRLARNQAAWSVIRLKLLAQKVTLRTSNGEFDMSDPTDKLMLGVLSEISAYDNALRAERSRLGKFNRIREGFWMGGPPPYGYTVRDKRLLPDKEEARWVRFIFESYRDGQTVYQIRSKLLANGVRTRRKRKIWSAASIAALLTNTHYVGHYDVTDKKSGEKITSVCDPIMPLLLWEEVAAARQKRSLRRIKESSQKHFYLLRDFLICGHCGSHFSGRHYPKIPARSVYYCPRKERNYANKGTDKVRECSNSRYLKVTQADELVWDTVLNVLLNSAAFKRETRDEIYAENRSQEQYERETTRLKKQVRQLDRQIRDLTETISRLAAEKNLSATNPKQVADIRTTIEEQLTALRKKRDDLMNTVKAREAADEWDDWIYKHDQLLDHLPNLDPEDQIYILKHVVKSIVVETVDTQTHRLTINFKLPYHGGRLDETISQNSAALPATGGKDLIEITLSRAKKNYKQR